MTHFTRPEPNDSDEFTRLLDAIRAGDASTDALLPMMYEALRELASQRLAREAADHTLQATALVHEVYLKLTNQEGGVWNDRRHFLATAARAMRQILVDHARARLAAKRGGDRQREGEVEGVVARIDPPDDRLLAIDDALGRLEQSDARKASIVHLRYFAGLTVAQTAAALDLSIGTVEREWRYIRAWLRTEIERQQPVSDADTGV